jgi:hypothetical protein
MLSDKQLQTNKIETTTRLTDAQLVLLTAAARREDGLVTLREGASPAAKRTVGVLLRRGLIEEAPVVAGQSCWRRDEDDKPVGAMITQAGLAALGIVAVAAMEEAQENPRVRVDLPSEPVVDEVAQNHKGRPGTKRALVIGLLRQSEGASLDELIGATGWLPHTTRAALTGLRQKGFVLAKSQRVDGKAIYRIKDTSPNAACPETPSTGPEALGEDSPVDVATVATTAQQAA